MSTEYRKLLIGIDTMDAPLLRARVRRLAEWVGSRNQPANFSVATKQRDGSWADIESGTKDYCIGYATAMDIAAGCVGAYRAVAPSGYVVWPEEDEGWPSDGAEGGA
jgi:hypothetical protein